VVTRRLRWLRWSGQAANWTWWSVAIPGWPWLQSALQPLLVDLYTTPETVKTVVQQAKDDLAREEVQHARLLVQDLASEADIHITEIPLATYPAAIKAVAPSIDAGKLDEAKAALQAALNTLVIETYVVPPHSCRSDAGRLGCLGRQKGTKAGGQDEAAGFHSGCAS